MEDPLEKEGIFHIGICNNLIYNYLLKEAWKVPCKPISGQDSLMIRIISEEKCLT